jgi:hypothetical protein
LKEKVRHVGFSVLIYYDAPSTKHHFCHYKKLIVNDPLLMLKIIRKRFIYILNVLKSMAAALEVS